MSGNFLELLFKVECARLFPGNKSDKDNKWDEEQHNDLAHFHAWCRVYARGKVVLTTRGRN